MDLTVKNDYDPDSWAEIIMIYNGALKKINTKLEILNDEFQMMHRYNPIEHIKFRIKSSESIVKKLKKKGYDSTLQNMVDYVNDIAGIRVICSFTSDIYKLADMIANQPDINVQYVKDYIANPKESGYRSYHMHVTTPVYLSEKAIDVKVEIQIRTVAMDFWASLEHKIKYKFEGNAPAGIIDQLRDCSDMIAVVDEKMLSLNKEILSFNGMEEF